MNEVMNRSEEIADLLKNFSNKTKLSILCFLWEYERNVWEIEKNLWVSQSQISQYLWRMKIEWILECKKIWKEVYYKISDTKIKEIIKFLKLIFNK